MKRESTEELRARLLADGQVQSMIAMRAYEIFELRGGTPGHEAEDWFQAEAEILRFVIEEEVRRSEAHSSPEEPSAVAEATPPFTRASYDTTEKRIEIFASVETEVAPPAEPAARAASAGGGIASKNAATPPKTGSPEVSTKAASPPKKAADRLKPPKGSDKKASGKSKAPKKAGAKTKKSKQRPAETEKDK
jgi:hypothetical protein